MSEGLHGPRRGRPPRMQAEATVRESVTEIDPFADERAPDPVPGLSEEEWAAASAPAADTEAIPTRAIPGGDYELIETAPKSGGTVCISEDAENYVRAAWHATRRMHLGKWEATGWWIDPLTRTKIEMHPIVWRPDDTRL